MNNKIKGNIKIRTELEKIVQNNNILHSYLFLGKDGIGKSKIAEEFAKKILCLTKEENCNCKSCICFETHNHPDMKIVNQESETIKINTVREMIQDIYEKPIQSDKKIYIINDCDKMTKEGQNSLLKTLEEPPEYIVIILIASNSDMILNTIKSRCTKITFEELKNDEIQEILKEKEISTDVPNNVYELFNGSIGKALKILEKNEDYKQLDEFVNSIEKMDKLEFLTQSKSIFIKEEINEILEYIIVLLFHLGHKNNDIRYLNCTYIIQETINHLKSNSNFDMSIDDMLFKVWEEVNR